jgi:hypothetical protein
MLVIAGAVFATVFMILAALSVTLSHRDAGGRVIGTAAGLILLFMGYSIFKIVMINAFRYPNTPRTSITKLAQPALQRLSPANTPNNPADPGIGARRSNLPVQPFYNARQAR